MTTWRHAFAVISAGMLVLWSCVVMAQQSVEEVNTPFQLCCSTNRAAAEKVARRVEASIPGLQTRIARESCRDAVGNEVDFFALYVWHETLTAGEICEQLGQKECDRCLKHARDFCPESLDTSQGQGN